MEEESKPIEPTTPQEPAGTPDNNLVDPLADAKAVAEEMKKQNATFAENLKRQEKLLQEEIISGRARATKQPSQADIENADCQKWLKGTGYDDMFK